MTRPALDRIPAPLLSVGATVSLQFGAAIARDHFDAVGPIGASLLRLLFASALLIAILRPRVWRWSRAQWAAAVLLGVALGGMNVLIYLSFQYIPIGVAVTIEFLGPLALALAQTRRWVDALWSLLALAGVVLLGARATVGLDALGIVFAVGAAACWAGYILASAHLGRRSVGSGGLAVAMVVATLVAAPLGASGAAGAAAEPWLIAVFLLVAVMSSAVPYALELEALRRLPTRVFGVLQSLGPATAALAGLVVLGEALHWQEIAALALVSAASVGITLAARR